MRDVSSPPPAADPGEASRSAAASDLVLSRRSDAGASETDGGETDAPVVYVIDFDRARLYGGPVPLSRCAADIRRLARSARKLRGGLGADGWRAMADGYGRGWPLSPEETAALG